ncbi:Gfo/Idh/MocA family protein [Nocardioides hwasunensis]|uniref:Gfo/Idh/MocA family oxidoreductase n=1 Tax=Nocardioides hwasunensis TaxID=397258 RepID=A0ABR8MIZ6_9ACTN|nr:Gfo/Idh/MocA family oxidoreductase [Nocardioides hwasunensis]MBD3915241.1 Gfo/Idh/MocA family oxidoreductase [Nocardioides hwasunensis]
MSTTPTPQQGPMGIAVIGAGYWGPNLVRNFASSPDWDLRVVCDLDLERARKVAGPHVEVTDDLERVLDDPTIHAVAIATPARTHHGLALQALSAGKHVVVEKPLADSVARGRMMVDLADAQGLVLMTDHTFCYTPVVQKMRELVVSGELGQIHFIDSVRINLGLVQPDIDVLWDLAPHDLAILDHILPSGLPSEGIGATGADPIGAGRACVGHLTLPLPDDGLAHVHVNWLSPTKIRQMVIGGSRRTLVWDDLNPQQRLSVYDRGVDLARTSVGGTDRTASSVSYRLGDTWSPALPEREALGAMVTEFAAAIREGRPALTDGHSGLRVLEVLEQASHRLAAQSGTTHQSGPMVPAGPPPVPQQATAPSVLEGVR